MECLKLAPILQQQTKAEISGGTWKLPDKSPLETADINWLIKKKVNLIPLATSPPHLKHGWEVQTSITGSDQICWAAAKESCWNPKMTIFGVIEGHLLGLTGALLWTSTPLRSKKKQLVRCCLLGRSLDIVLEVRTGKKFISEIEEIVNKIKNHVKDGEG